MTLEQLEQKHRELGEEIKRLKSQKKTIELPTEFQSAFQMNIYFEIFDTLQCEYRNNSSMVFQSKELAEIVRDAIKPTILLWKIHYEMYLYIWIPNKSEPYYSINRNLDHIFSCLNESVSVTRQHVPFKSEQDAQLALDTLKRYI